MSLTRFLVILVAFTIMVITGSFLLLGDIAWLGLVGAWSCGILLFLLSRRNTSQHPDSS